MIKVCKFGGSSVALVVAILLAGCCTKTATHDMEKTMTETPKATLIKLDFIDQPEIVVVGKVIRCNLDLSTIEVTPPVLWGHCFSDGTFTTLETLTDFIHDPAYVGYMDSYDPATGNFDYLCGMMTKPGVPVPEGFVSRTLKPAKDAIGWIKGKEGDVYGKAHSLTEHAMAIKGMKPDASHGWSMEVYTCPRFTTPDENGDIILDYYLPYEL